MNFDVGDRVVYPMHGAGVIERVEEKEVLGESQDYYIMKLPIGDMKVMIPVDGVEQIGLREVINEEQLKHVFDVLRSEKTAMSSNWNRRYRANAEKLKTGDIYEVAEVVRNLTIRDQERGVSTGERKMLDNARQILVSELVLAKDIDEVEANNLLDEVLAEGPDTIDEEEASES
jgi:CarD family transcriptional regulator